jgi:hypothetical protein
MAAAVFPTSRHDRAAWHNTDQARSELVGNSMAMRSCLLYCDCDWAEIGGPLGFPPHSDGLRPCYYCNASPDMLCQLCAVSQNSAGPFRENTEADYYQACDRCEKIVSISAAQHRDICNKLQYDKRDAGFKGLSLRSDVESVPGLVAGMRVEPNRLLRDVKEFFTISRFPAEVLFWHVSLESLARHRNPFFDRSIGITLTRVLNPDTLHCLYLGVFNVLIWAMMKSGAWALKEHGEL